MSFTGGGDWRFLFLIALSSMVDFFIAQRIDEEENSLTRKLLLYGSLLVNLGLLGFFKYYNFFVDSFTDAFTLFGRQLDDHTLNIILPVGISFYTFQTLSYTIDVYRKKLVPTRSLLEFSAFVSFFPQLVAGPIERAKDLLPQFYAPRVFSYTGSVDGLRQILFGLFKKVVIADNCAIIVNQVFADHETMGAGVLIFGAVAFAFQIYGDFSGYSDIAIGLARMMGFKLTRNFAYPYFSRDIAEFWRRWHISLSSWFKDYLYIPLGGSRGGKWMQIRNTAAIFLVSGFWHGANWTFLFWGALHALLFLPLILTRRNRNNLEIVGGQRNLPSLTELGQMLITFTLVTILWIFFRAENISQAFEYLYGIVSRPLALGQILTAISPRNLLFLFHLLG